MTWDIGVESLSDLAPRITCRAVRRQVLASPAPVMITTSHVALYKTRRVALVQARCYARTLTTGFRSCTSTGRFPHPVYDCARSTVLWPRPRSEGSVAESIKLGPATTPRAVAVLALQALPPWRFWHGAMPAVGKLSTLAWLRLNPHTRCPSGARRFFRFGRSALAPGYSSQLYLGHQLDHGLRTRRLETLPGALLDGGPAADGAARPGLGAVAVTA
jgi:hypothetical protein